MSNIIWKRMIYHGKDLGDFYLVSNTGEIKNAKTGIIRKKNINKEGYYFVGVSLGSRDIKPVIKIHRAVAETFLKNPNNYPVINHKDGNKLNNDSKNLEFCTYSHNTIHAIENKLMTAIDNKKQIICLNTLEVFDSVSDAARWCGCVHNTISHSLSGYRNRKTGGKHPVTKEPLTWMMYSDYKRYCQ